ncbi:Inorganic triphosphatase [Galdieria sulphuraria]|nr:Inorganic triphosphatase [Galdieria sulphuraria]
MLRRSHYLFVSTRYFAHRKRLFSTRSSNLKFSTIASFGMDLTHDKGQKSNVEIERKFLVLSTEYRDKSVRKYTIRQGYVFASKDKSVRVRLTDEEAYLTIKEQLLNSLCLKPLIEKTRYLVEDKGFIWEVDEFLGDNIGLVVAEVELNDEQVHLELPDWVGKEVTEDTRFYNSVLFQSPFCFWPLEERQKILRTK